MCFGLYTEDVERGDGRDWIECVCGRWLHEDCAEDSLLDKDGFVILANVCSDYSLLCLCDYDVKNLFVQLYMVIKHT